MKVSNILSTVKNVLPLGNASMHQIKGRLGDGRNHAGMVAVVNAKPPEDE